MSQVSTCVALTPHTNTNSADRPGDCPPSVARAMGDLCNNDSNVCDDSGNCVGSYCLRFTGLQECQCTAADGYDEIRFCDVCCRYEGRCQSTFDLFVRDVQCLQLHESGNLTNQDSSQVRTPHIRTLHKSGHLINQDTSQVRTPHIRTLHKSGHLKNQDTLQIKTLQKSKKHLTYQGSSLCNTKH